MFCKFCGKEIADNSAICIHCGKTVKHKNISALASTLGTLGFVFSILFTPIGLILSTVSLILYARQESKEDKGFAIAGLIISIVIINFILTYWISYLSYYQALHNTGINLKNIFGQ